MLLSTLANQIGKNRARQILTCHGIQSPGESFSSPIKAILIEKYCFTASSFHS